jgi:hypothetical protein
MYIKKDDKGNIIGAASIPQDDSGWAKSEDREALDSFLKNGPPKTEAQLDTEDRMYYQQFVDPILIKAIYAKADELGLDLSEAITLKAARKAKRSK